MLGQQLLLCAAALTLLQCACAVHPFQYSKKMSDEVYNAVITATDPTVLERIRATLSIFLQQHPYFSSSTSAAVEDLLQKPSPSLLEQWIGLTPNEADKAFAPESSISVHFKSACETVKKWKRLNIDERCAANLQSIVCSFRPLVGSLLKMISARNDTVKEEASRVFAHVTKNANAGFDSFGKVQSGLAEGNYGWYGSYDQCEGITAKVPINDGVQNQYDSIAGKHCTMHLSPRQGAQKMNDSKGNIIERQQCSPLRIKLGVCAPQACSNLDLMIVYENMIDRLPGSELLRNLTCPTYISCEEPPSVIGDYWIIGTIAFIFVVLIMIGVGTFYDYFVYLPTLNNLPKSREPLLGNEANGDAPQHIELTKSEYMMQLPIYWKVFLCFSCYTNGLKILSTERREGTMECVHGIRFISMCWVILGHTYFFAPSFIENPTLALKLPTQPMFMIINNATVSVDTFFVLSGFLLAYLFLERVAKTGPAMMKSFGFWIMYYVHRYLRLTPVYMIVIGVTWGIWNYIGDGPMWTNKYENGLINECPERWWQNALYINNLYDFDKQCIGWTWYLANDMQFYWLTPPLLVLFYYSPLVSILFSLFVIIASSVARAWVVAENGLPFAPITTTRPNKWIGKMSDYTNMIYQRPYMRIGSYMVGLLLGLLLHKTKGKFKSRNALDSLTTFALWCAIMSMQWAVLFVPFHFANTGEFDQAGGVFYAAVWRVFWSASVAGVIYMCLQGRGGFINSILSWPAWFPVSRLTYCAYLVHELVLYYIYSSLRKPEYGSNLRTVHKCALILKEINAFQAYVFAAALCIAYAIAFIVSVMFEAPVMNLEKLLLGDALNCSRAKNDKKKKKKSAA